MVPRAAEGYAWQLKINTYKTDAGTQLINALILKCTNLLILTRYQKCNQIRVSGFHIKVISMAIKTMKISYN